MVRLKHRYLVLHFLYPSLPSTNQPSTPLPVPLQFSAPTPDTLTPALLTRLIRDSLSLLFGDYGSGMVSGSLKIMYLSTPTSTAIVRVSRAHYRLVWAALTMVGRLEGEKGVRGRKEPGREVVIRVVRVSGTVRKCEEEVIRRGMEVIRRARRDGEGREVGILDDGGGRERERENGMRVMDTEDEEEEEEEEEEDDDDDDEED
ncbi:Ribonuclease P/MRP protein subunit POP5 [Sphaceloma murrayae]|uniref:Ribonuclease P/MRP protein subunit POP5 n=1 Tax=Sphaceloma murrayae TaxID=2082308 RepID=A0A2K1QUS0_9PEZI|nr:Ribonuclease P/MRP protein subunit POP5 [Sphaceloma murrayae]